MTQLQKAFKAWTDTFPGAEGDCECPTGSGNHFVYREETQKQGAMVLDLVRRYPKADALVCARERAWRAYISIRDCKNYKVEK
jgi:hypothetical protein